MLKEKRGQEEQVELHSPVKESEGTMESWRRPEVIELTIQETFGPGS